MTRRVIIQTIKYFMKEFHECIWWYICFIFFSHWSHEDMWGRILHGGIITGIWLMKEFNICEISYICHRKLYQRLYENQPRVLKLQNHGLVEVCYFILRCSDWIPRHNNYIWVVVTFVTIIIVYIELLYRQSLCFETIQEGKLECSLVLF